MAGVIVAVKLGGGAGDLEEGWVNCRQRNQFFDRRRQGARRPENGQKCTCALDEYSLVYQLLQQAAG